MLPDEYFLLGMDGKLEDELPDYDIAECVPNFGGSEGIYLDITLIYVEKGKVHRDRFATGKTLEKVQMRSSECHRLVQSVYLC